jgi:chemotaxis protein methyltransferase CheR
MDSAFTKNLFEVFRKTILDFCGIYIPEDAMTELGKKIQNRMNHLNLMHFAQYHALLQSSPDPNSEIRHLVEMITNNETYFFREPAHYRVLKNFIIPGLLRQKSEKKIRIWSAGCSTGEEVYSLAITVLESRMIVGPYESRVTGSDIDRQAIAVAQQGQFGKNSFRAIEPYYLNTYFKPHEDSPSDTRVVNDTVKYLTSFSYHNLFQEPYPSELTDLDIIFFRNVSIYFSKEKIEYINRKLSESLRPGGYLFLGSSETLHHNFGYMQLVEVDNVYLYQKTDPSHLSHSFPQDLTPLREQVKNIHSSLESIPLTTPIKKFVNAAEETLDKEPFSFNLVFALFKSGDYEQALTLMDQQTALDIPLLTLKTHMLIGQEKFIDARKNCEMMQTLEPLNAEVFFLMGLIEMYQKNYIIAADHFKRALFLKPELSLAHFQLASLYWLKDMKQDARREYRNTIKILEHHKDASLTFAALGYSSEYLINACKQYLQQ